MRKKVRWTTGTSNPEPKSGVAKESAVVPQHHVPTPFLEAKRPTQARPVAVVIAGAVRKQFGKRFRNISWGVFPYGLARLVLHLRRVHAWVLHLPTVNRPIRIRALTGRAWHTGWIADNIFCDVNHCVRVRFVVALLVHVRGRAGRAWKVGWTADDLLCYACQ